jgi:hypothetical protein
MNAERAAPYVTAFALALPTLLVYYPPMSDLPLHEAVIGVLKNFGDSTYNPGLYKLNFGHPNQLFVVVTWLLSYVVSLTLACKIIIALSIVGIVLGADRLAGYLDAPRWAALLVAPLGLGWMYFWGLVANMVGLAALLWTLPALDRFARKPTMRALPKMIGVCVFLFFAHESMVMVACGFMLLIALLEPPSLPATLLRVAVPVIAFGLALLEVKLLGQNTITATIATVWGSELHRVYIVPGLISAGYEPWVRHLVFGLAMLALVLLLLPRLRALGAPKPIGDVGADALSRWRSRLLDARFEVLAGFLVAAYFAFPLTLHGATLVYHRFLPPAWAIGVLALARRRAAQEPMHRLTPLVAAVVPCSALLVAVPVFLDADSTYRDLDQLVAPIDRGQSIISVELGPTGGNRLYSPQTAEGHVMAVKGGRDFFDFTLSHISAAYMKPEHHLQETYARLSAAPYTLVPEHDLKRFRYVLVHTRDPMRGAASVHAFAPEGKFLGNKGEWYLFESTLPMLPLTAPDEPLLDKRALTLHLRIIVSLQRLEGKTVGDVLRIEAPDGP